MKLRNATVLSILAMLGVACAGAVLAVYTDVSVKASAPDFAAGLKSIPSDCQFVFGANIRKFTQSRASSIPRQAIPMEKDLTIFTEQTGLNPARDITYLVGGANGKEKASGIVIISGVFDKDAIMSYARSRPAAVEQSYAGVPLMIFPDQKSDAAPKGFAFINDQEIALGDVESLKSVLDIQGHESRSVLNSPTMASLIKGIAPDEMFWFAGDASGLLSKAPSAVSASLRTGTSNIKSIVGSFDMGDALTGKIVATASNPDQALKLADAIRGLMAIGQLTSSKNPDLQSLFAGLVISQESDRVRVDLNIPADVLAKLSQRSSARRTD